MHAHPILDNRVQLLCTGLEDFTPKQGITNLSKAVQPIRETLGGIHAVATRLGFTTVWTRWSNDLGSPLRLQWSVEGAFYRQIDADNKADGISIDERDVHTVLAGFNADCPFGVIIWPDGRLGFCHLGLECLLPKDGSPSILETGGLVPGCKVHLTAGIRPCCYGRNDDGFEYAFKRFPEAQGGTASKGPRKGQPSLDLHQLARSILAKLDITDVTWDALCTACAATPDRARLYFSNVYGDTGRNCVAVKRIAL